MLVICSSEGKLRWINITEALNRYGDIVPKRIPFDSRPLTADAILDLRDSVIGLDADQPN
jgi:hypothetical protein